eukprot:m.214449 g.214449  ORF g.214449 m.214449 type:complete len:245 (-) comp33176_c6_seq7:1217-1951(-)
MGASQGKLEDHQIDSRVFSAFQAFKLQTKSGPPQLPRKQIEAVLDSLLPHGEIFSKACCTVWLKTDQEFVSLRGYAEFVALALGHGFEYTPGAQDTQPQPISLQRFYCDVFNSTSTLTKTAATRQLLETLKSLTGWDDPKSADASSSSPSTSSPSTSLQSTCPRICVGDRAFEFLHKTKRVTVRGHPSVVTVTNTACINRDRDYSAVSEAKVFCVWAQGREVRREECLGGVELDHCHSKRRPKL